MTTIASRPWRNRNPGDLRTLPAGQHWAGQSGTDTSPGGPFAIFGTRVDGWRALATNLLAYGDIHGLHTVRGIVGRFAPALENDTGGYISLVCGQIGRGPDQTISVHDEPTMLVLVKAIALAEGGARLAWPAGEIVAGVRLAGVAGVVAPAPQPAPDPADALDALYNKGA
jgi:hypothetical protein